jgi:uncharacterized membrane protein
MKKISIKEVFKKSWKNVKANMLFLVTSTFVYFVLSDLLKVDGKREMGSLFIFIASVIVSILFSVGMYRSGLYVNKGRELSMDVFKVNPQLLLTVLWLTIISAFFTTLGLILLIIPGLIVMARISMASYVLLDRHGNMTAYEAVKESWSLTKGHTLKILLYFLCIFGLVLLSFLTLGLALVVVTPFIYISGAEIYSILKKEEHAHE